MSESEMEEATPPSEKASFTVPQIIITHVGQDDEHNAAASQIESSNLQPANSRRQNRRHSPAGSPTPKKSRLEEEDQGEGSVDTPETGLPTVGGVEQAATARLLGSTSKVSDPNQSAKEGAVATTSAAAFPPSMGSSYLGGGRSARSRNVQSHENNLVESPDQVSMEIWSGFLNTLSDVDLDAINALKSVSKQWKHLELNSILTKESSIRTNVREKRESLQQMMKTIIYQSDLKFRSGGYYDIHWGKHSSFHVMLHVSVMKHDYAVALWMLELLKGTIRKKKYKKAYQALNIARIVDEAVNGEKETAIKWTMEARETEGQFTDSYGKLLIILANGKTSVLTHFQNTKKHAFNVKLLKYIDTLLGNSFTRDEDSFRPGRDIITEDKAHCCYLYSEQELNPETEKAFGLIGHECPYHSFSNFHTAQRVNISKPVIDICMSPCSRYVVAITQDKEILIHEIYHEDYIVDFYFGIKVSKRPHRTNAAAWSSNGRLLAYCGSAGHRSDENAGMPWRPYLAIMDFNYMRIFYPRVPQEFYDANGLCFLKDSYDLAISDSETGFVKIYVNIIEKPNHQVISFEGHRIRELHAISNEIVVGVDSFNRCIAFNKQENTKNILFEESREVKRSIVDSIGRHMVVSTDTGYHIWDLVTKSFIRSYHIPQDDLNVSSQFCFAGDFDEFLMMPGAAGNVYFFHTNTSVPIGVVSVGDSRLESMCWIKNAPGIFIAHREPDKFEVYHVGRSFKSCSEGDTELCSTGSKKVPISLFVTRWQRRIAAENRRSQRFQNDNIDKYWESLPVQRPEAVKNAKLISQTCGDAVTIKRAADPSEERNRVVYSDSSDSSATLNIADFNNLDEGQSFKLRSYSEDELESYPVRDASQDSNRSPDDDNTTPEESDSNVESVDSDVCDEEEEEESVSDEEDDDSSSECTFEMSSEDHHSDISNISALLREKKYSRKLSRHWKPMESDDDMYDSDEPANPARNRLNVSRGILKRRYVPESATNVSMKQQRPARDESTRNANRSDNSMEDDSNQDMEPTTSRLLVVKNTLDKVAKTSEKKGDGKLFEVEAEPNVYIGNNELVVDMQVNLDETEKRRANKKRKMPVEEEMQSGDSDEAVDGDDEQDDVPDTSNRKKTTLTKKLFSTYENTNLIFRKVYDGNYLAAITQAPSHMVDSPTVFKILKKSGIPRVLLKHHTNEHGRRFRETFSSDEDNLPSKRERLESSNLFLAKPSDSMPSLPIYGRFVQESSERPPFNVTDGDRLASRQSRTRKRLACSNRNKERQQDQTSGADRTGRRNASSNNKSNNRNSNNRNSNSRNTNNDNSNNGNSNNGNSNNGNSNNGNNNRNNNNRNNNNRNNNNRNNNNRNNNNRNNNNRNNNNRDSSNGNNSSDSSTAETDDGITPEIRKVIESPSFAVLAGRIFWSLDDPITYETVEKWIVDQLKKNDGVDLNTAIVRQQVLCFLRFLTEILFELEEDVSHALSASAIVAQAAEQQSQPSTSGTQTQRERSPIREADEMQTESMDVSHNVENVSSTSDEIRNADDVANADSATKPAELILPINELTNFIERMSNLKHQLETTPLVQDFLHDEGPPLHEMFYPRTLMSLISGIRKNECPVSKERQYAKVRSEFKILDDKLNITLLTLGGNPDLTHINRRMLKEVFQTMMDFFTTISRKEINTWTRNQMNNFYEDLYSFRVAFDEYCHELKLYHQELEKHMMSSDDESEQSSSHSDEGDAATAPIQDDGAATAPVQEDEAATAPVQEDEAATAPVQEGDAATATVDATTERPGSVSERSEAPRLSVMHTEEEIEEFNKKLNKTLSMIKQAAKNLSTPRRVTRRGSQQKPQERWKTEFLLEDNDIVKGFYSDIANTHELPVLSADDIEFLLDNDSDVRESSNNTTLTQPVEANTNPTPEQSTTKRNKNKKKQAPENKKNSVVGSFRAVPGNVGQGGSRIHPDTMNAIARTLANSMLKASSRRYDTPTTTNPVLSEEMVRSQDSLIDDENRNNEDILFPVYESSESEGGAVMLKIDKLFSNPDSQGESDENDQQDNGLNLELVCRNTVNRSFDLFESFNSLLRRLILSTGHPALPDDTSFLAEKTKHFIFNGVNIDVMYDLKLVDRNSVPLSTKRLKEQPSLIVAVVRSLQKEDQKSFLLQRSFLEKLVSYCDEQITNMSRPRRQTRAQKRGLSKPFYIFSSDLLPTAKLTNVFIAMDYLREHEESESIRKLLNSDRSLVDHGAENRQTLSGFLSHFQSFLVDKPKNKPKNIVEEIDTAAAHKFSALKWEIVIQRCLHFHNLEEQKKFIHLFKRYNRHFSKILVGLCAGKKPCMKDIPVFSVTRVLHRIANENHHLLEELFPKEVLKSSSPLGEIIRMDDHLPRKERLARLNELFGKLNESLQFAMNEAAEKEELTYTSLKRHLRILCPRDDSPPREQRNNLRSSLISRAECQDNATNNYPQRVEQDPSRTDAIAAALEWNARIDEIAETVNNSAPGEDQRRNEEDFQRLQRAVLGRSRTTPVSNNSNSQRSSYTVPNLTPAETLLRRNTDNSSAPAPITSGSSTIPSTPQIGALPATYPAPSDSQSINPAAPQSMDRDTPTSAGKLTTFGNQATTQAGSTANQTADQPNRTNTQETSSSEQPDNQEETYFAILAPLLDPRFFPFSAMPTENMDSAPSSGSQATTPAPVSSQSSDHAARNASQTTNGVSSTATRRIEMPTLPDIRLATSDPEAYHQQCMMVAETFHELSQIQFRTAHEGIRRMIAEAQSEDVERPLPQVESIGSQAVSTGESAPTIRTATQAPITDMRTTTATQAVITGTIAPTIRAADRAPITDDRATTTSSANQANAQAVLQDQRSQPNVDRTGDTGTTSRIVPQNVISSAATQTRIQPVARDITEQAAPPRSQALPSHTTTQNARTPSQSATTGTTARTSSVGTTHASITANQTSTTPASSLATPEGTQTVTQTATAASPDANRNTTGAAAPPTSQDDRETSPPVPQLRRSLRLAPQVARRGCIGIGHLSMRSTYSTRALPASRFINNRSTRQSGRQPRVEPEPLPRRIVDGPFRQLVSDHLSGSQRRKKKRGGPSAEFKTVVRKCHKEELSFNNIPKLIPGCVMKVLHLAADRDALNEAPRETPLDVFSLEDLSNYLDSNVGQLLPEKIQSYFNSIILQHPSRCNQDTYSSSVQFVNANMVRELHGYISKCLTHDMYDIYKENFSETVSASEMKEHITNVILDLFSDELLGCLIVAATDILIWDTDSLFLRLMDVAPIFRDILPPALQPVVAVPLHEALPNLPDTAQIPPPSGDVPLAVELSSDSASSPQSPMEQTSAQSSPTQSNNDSSMEQEPFYEDAVPSTSQQAQPSTSAASSNNRRVTSEDEEDIEEVTQAGPSSSSQDPQALQHFPLANVPQTYASNYGQSTNINVQSASIPGPHAITQLNHPSSVNIRSQAYVSTIEQPSILRIYDIANMMSSGIYAVRNPRSDTAGQHPFTPWRNLTPEAVRMHDLGRNFRRGTGPRNLAGQVRLAVEGPSNDMFHQFVRSYGIGVQLQSVSAPIVKYDPLTSLPHFQFVNSIGTQILYDQWNCFIYRYLPSTNIICDVDSTFLIRHTTRISEFPVIINTSERSVEQLTFGAGDHSTFTRDTNPSICLITKNIRNYPIVHIPGADLSLPTHHDIFTLTDQPDIKIAVPHPAVYLNRVDLGNTLQLMDHAEIGKVPFLVNVGCYTMDEYLDNMQTIIHPDAPLESNIATAVFVFDGDNSFKIVTRHIRTYGAILHMPNAVLKSTDTHSVFSWDLDPNIKLVCYIAPAKFYAANAARRDTPGLVTCELDDYTEIMAPYHANNWQINSQILTCSAPHYFNRVEDGVVNIRYHEFTRIQMYPNGSDPLGIQVLRRHELYLSIVRQVIGRDFVIPDFLQGLDCNINDRRMFYSRNVNYAHQNINPAVDPEVPFCNEYLIDKLYENHAITNFLAFLRVAGIQCSPFGWSTFIESSMLVLFRDFLRHFILFSASSYDPTTLPCQMMHTVNVYNDILRPIFMNNFLVYLEISEPLVTRRNDYIPHDFVIIMFILRNFAAYMGFERVAKAADVYKATLSCHNISAEDFASVIPSPYDSILLTHIISQFALKTPNVVRHPVTLTGNPFESHDYARRSPGPDDPDDSSPGGSSGGSLGGFSSGSSSDDQPGTSGGGQGNSSQSNSSNAQNSNQGENRNASTSNSHGEVMDREETSDDANGDVAETSRNSSNSQNANNNSDSNEDILGISGLPKNKLMKTFRYMTETDFLPSYLQVRLNTARVGSWKRYLSSIQSERLLRLVNPNADASTREMEDEEFLKDITSRLAILRKNAKEADICLQTIIARLVTARIRQTAHRRYRNLLRSSSEHQIGYLGFSPRNRPVRKFYPVTKSTTEENAMNTSSDNQSKSAVGESRSSDALSEEASGVQRSESMRSVAEEDLDDLHPDNDFLDHFLKDVESRDGYSQSINAQVNQIIADVISSTNEGTDMVKMLFETMESDKFNEFVDEVVDQHCSVLWSSHDNDGMCCDFDSEEMIDLSELVREDGAHFEKVADARTTMDDGNLFKTSSNLKRRNSDGNLEASSNAITESEAFTRFVHMNFAKAPVTLDALEMTPWTEEDKKQEVLDRERRLQTDKNDDIDDIIRTIYAPYGGYHSLTLSINDLSWALKQFQYIALEIDYLNALLAKIALNRIEIVNRFSITLPNISVISQVEETIFCEAHVLYDTLLHLSPNESLFNTFEKSYAITLGCLVVIQKYTSDMIKNGSPTKSDDNIASTSQKIELSSKAPPLDIQTFEMSQVKQEQAAAEDFMLFEHLFDDWYPQSYSIESYIPNQSSTPISNKRQLLTINNIEVHERLDLCHQRAEKIRQFSILPVMPVLQLFQDQMQGDSLSGLGVVGYHGKVTGAAGSLVPCVPEQLQDYLAGNMKDDIYLFQKIKKRHLLNCLSFLDVQRRLCVDHIYTNYGINGQVLEYDMQDQIYHTLPEGSQLAAHNYFLPGTHYNGLEEFRMKMSPAKRKSLERTCIKVQKVYQNWLGQYSHLFICYFHPDIKLFDELSEQDISFMKRLAQFDKRLPNSLSHFLFQQASFPFFVPVTKRIDRIIYDSNNVNIIVGRSRQPIDLMAALKLDGGPPKLTAYASLPTAELYTARVGFPPTMYDNVFPYLLISHEKGVPRKTTSEENVFYPQGEEYEKYMVERKLLAQYYNDPFCFEKAQFSLAVRRERLMSAQNTSKVYSHLLHYRKLLEDENKLEYYRRKILFKGPRLPKREYPPIFTTYVKPRIVSTIPPLPRLETNCFTYASVNLLNSESDDDCDSSDDLLLDPVKFDLQSAFYESLDPQPSQFSNEGLRKNSIYLDKELFEEFEGLGDLECLSKLGFFDSKYINFFESLQLERRFNGNGYAADVDEFYCEKAKQQNYSSSEMSFMDMFPSSTSKKDPNIYSSDDEDWETSEPETDSEHDSHAMSVDDDEQMDISPDEESEPNAYQYLSVYMPLGPKLNKFLNTDDMSVAFIESSIDEMQNYLLIPIDYKVIPHDYLFIAERIEGIMPYHYHLQQIIVYFPQKIKEFLTRVYHVIVRLTLMGNSIEQGLNFWKLERETHLEYFEFQDTQPLLPFGFEIDAKIMSSLEVDYILRYHQDEMYLLDAYMERLSDHGINVPFQQDNFYHSTHELDDDLNFIYNINEDRPELNDITFSISNHEMLRVPQTISLKDMTDEIFDEDAFYEEYMEVRRELEQHETQRRSYFESMSDDHDDYQPCDHTADCPRYATHTTLNGLIKRKKESIQQYTIETSRDIMESFPNEDEREHFVKLSGGIPLRYQMIYAYIRSLFFEQNGMTDPLEQQFRRSGEPFKCFLIRPQKTWKVGNDTISCKPPPNHKDNISRLSRKEWDEMPLLKEPNEVDAFFTIAVKPKISILTRNTDLNERLKNCKYSLANPYELDPLPIARNLIRGVSKLFERVLRKDMRGSSFIVTLPFSARCQACRTASQRPFSIRFYPQADESDYMKKCYVELDKEYKNSKLCRQDRDDLTKSSDMWKNNNFTTARCQSFSLSEENIEDIEELMDCEFVINKERRAVLIPVQMEKVKTLLARLNVVIFRMRTRYQDSGGRKRSREQDYDTKEFYERYPMNRTLLANYLPKIEGFAIKQRGHHHVNRLFEIENSFNENEQAALDRFYDTLEDQATIAPHKEKVMTKDEIKKFMIELVTDSLHGSYEEAPEEEISQTIPDTEGSVTSPRKRDWRMLSGSIAGVENPDDVLAFTIKRRKRSQRQPERKTTLIDVTVNGYTYEFSKSSGSCISYTQYERMRGCEPDKKVAKLPQSLGYYQNVNAASKRPNFANCFLVQHPLSGKGADCEINEYQPDYIHQSEIYREAGRLEVKLQHSISSQKKQRKYNCDLSHRCRDAIENQREMTTRKPKGLLSLFDSGYILDEEFFKNDCITKRLLAFANNNLYKGKPLTQRNRLEEDKWFTKVIESRSNDIM